MLESLYRNSFKRNSYSGVLIWELLYRNSYIGFVVQKYRALQRARAWQWLWAWLSARPQDIREAEHPCSSGCDVSLTRWRSPVWFRPGVDSPHEPKMILDPKDKAGPDKAGPAGWAVTTRPPGGIHCLVLCLGTGGPCRDRRQPSGRGRGTVPPPGIAGSIPSAGGRFDSCDLPMPCGKFGSPTTQAIAKLGAEMAIEKAHGWEPVRLCMDMSSATPRAPRKFRAMIWLQAMSILDLCWFCFGPAAGWSFLRATLGLTRMGTLRGGNTSASRAEGPGSKLQWFQDLWRGGRSMNCWGRCLACAVPKQIKWAGSLVVAATTVWTDSDFIGSWPVLSDSLSS